MTAAPTLHQLGKLFLRGALAHAAGLVSNPFSVERPDAKLPEMPMGIAYDAGAKELVVSDVHNKVVRLPIQ